MSDTDVITIVSGLPHSGTSMMMRMLAAGGLDPVTDRVRTADIDNPGGYFEFELVKKIKDDVSWVPATRGKAFKMVAQLLKYLPPEFRYQVVFMRRDMQEMVTSQNKMLDRLGAPPTGIPDDKVIALFEKQLALIEPWLAERPNIRVLEVQYNDVLRTPEDAVRRIAGFVEQDLDVSAMASIVNPELYRNRSDAGPA